MNSSVIIIFFIAAVSMIVNVIQFITKDAHKLELEEARKKLAKIKKINIRAKIPAIDFYSFNTKDQIIKEHIDNAKQCLAGQVKDYIIAKKIPRVDDFQEIEASIEVVDPR